MSTCTQVEKIRAFKKGLIWGLFVVLHKGDDNAFKNNY
jgi:hypothetical protein